MGKDLSYSPDSRSLRLICERIEGGLEGGEFEDIDSAMVKAQAGFAMRQRLWVICLIGLERITLPTKL